MAKQFFCALDFLFNISLIYPLNTDYMTTKLPNLTKSLNESISVGKFVRATSRSCPKRNHILGEHFCRFAIKLQLYIDAANNVEPFDTNLLHKRYEDAIEKLCAPKTNESVRLKLPSTGQLLPDSVYKSLETWKQNCRVEVSVTFWKFQNKMRISIDFYLSFGLFSVERL